MISAVSGTWQNQRRCGCCRAERSRWQDPRVRTPARRTSCAAVVESSPSIRWKMNVARNVICWRRLTGLHNHCRVTAVCFFFFFFRRRCRLEFEQCRTKKGASGRSNLAKGRIATHIHLCIVPVYFTMDRHISSLKRVFFCGDQDSQ